MTDGEVGAGSEINCFFEYRLASLSRLKSSVRSTYKKIIERITMSTCASNCLRSPGRRRGHGLSRFLLVSALLLLGAAPAWSDGATVFPGLLQTLSTGGSISLTAPRATVVGPDGTAYIADTGGNRSSPPPRPTRPVSPRMPSTPARSATAPPWPRAPSATSRCSSRPSRWAP